MRSSWGHRVFAATCLLLAPLSAAAAPVGLSLPEKGEARSSTIGLKNLPKAFDLDGRAAGKALSRKAVEKGMTTRGETEAEIYRRISPSVVLVLTKKELGSGSVVGTDGTIVTNYHVVAGYEEVGIVFKPETEGEDPDLKKVLVAEVVKVDQVADLALLKLKTLPKNLPKPVVFGNFNSVAVGDDVNAIGHPTGQTWTFTRGYISQIRRNYEWKIDNGITHKADVIQTQTPINPGNSGGPLLNKGGELVGVNAFKDDGEGLNFAVGVTAVQDFLKRKGNRGGEQAVATIAGGANTAGNAKCKAQIVFNGRDDKNTKDIVAYDTDCNGVADLVFQRPDEKSAPVTVYVDEDENDKPEGVILSYKRDGFFNISYWDSDDDGKVDTVGYHPDGKLKPSSYGPYVEPDDAKPGDVKP